MGDPTRTPTSGDRIIGPLAQAIHIFSAYWVLVLALIILVDVSGRLFLNSPLLGAPEIIKNSVVSITFLQLPLAIYRGGMLRTTIVYDMVGPIGKRLVRTLSSLLGLAFFLGTAWSSWEPAVEAFDIGEYEGEGALRVPTWPVRFLVFATAAFSAVVYLHLVWLDWTGRFDDDEEEIVGV